MVKVAVAIESNQGMNSPVAYRFARAPYFAIVEINDKGMNMQIVQNPHVYGRGVGPLVAQWLASQGVNVVIAPSVGPNAASALSSFGIQVKTSPPGVPLTQALTMHGYTGGQ
ncbi:MAG: NifB/NifX family molybdenum-iron cluster-binding protein [Candidatus Njordarchaeia archaeon]